MTGFKKGVLSRSQLAGSRSLRPEMAGVQEGTGESFSFRRGPPDQKVNKERWKGGTQGSLGVKKKGGP